MQGCCQCSQLARLFIILLKFITKMSEPFPLEQFRDAFQVTPKIKNKLQPFMAQYKALKMEWIINSLEQLHNYFFEDKNDINLKFNSIFGIKFLFDTAEVVLVNLIEIYFLPRILEIASFDARGNEQKRGTGYFVSVGYPQTTPDIDKLSYNFVRLASEFIQAAAIIKPKRLYLSDEIEEPSDFFEACQRLQEQGWKPYAKPAYYKETAPVIAAQFKKSLQAFDPIADPYIDYYADFFRAHLQTGKPYPGRLNPKRVLESGDVYVTGAVIDLCTESFKSPSIRQRILALGLLNDFVKWGDIEAAYQINCTELMDDVLHEVANTNSGIMSLSRGKGMFNKLQSSEQLKQEFYVQVLKAIQFWSLCFPRAIKVKNRDSKIKLAHEELRMKLKIQFPEDKNLKENKMEFDRNINKKRTRNGMLLTQLENADPDYISIVPLPKASEKKIPSQKQTPMPPTSGQFAKIKASIHDAASCLDTILSNETAAPQKAQKLLKFRNDFEKSVESAEVSDQEFDQLLETGTPLVDRIEKILPHLNNYVNKKISFADFSAAINPKPLTGRSHTEKEVIKVTTSKLKIEEPPKSQKQIKLDEVSLKVEEKSVDKSSLKAEASLKNQTQVNLAQKTLKTMTVKETEQMKHDLSKILASVKDAKTEDAKFKQQIRPKEEAKVSLDKKSLNSMLSETKKVDPQITPIKKMQQEQKYSEERSLGSLPQVSKHSFTKQLDDSINNREELNIEPASHKIIEKKETVNLSLFKQKENSQKSSLKEGFQHPNFSKKNLQDEEQLQEDQIQHFVEVKHPKIIDNVKGSYRLKGEVSEPIIRSVQNMQNPRESRESSRQGSRINFQESKISKVQAPFEEEEDDIIVMPDINPLDMSYHDIGGYEEQIKGNKELSFKKCFEADKYLLGPDKNTKMFWLQKETISLIKSGSSRRNSRNKESTISIPQILSEKDKKYQEELRYIEEQKNRRIRELEKTINIHQNEVKHLQQKIVQQDKQIKSYKAESSISNSRAKKNFYLEDQDQLFRTRHAQKNGREKERSFYNEPPLKESKCLEPQGKLISSRRYGDYFASFTEQKRKKNLLKNKQLLYKDDTIEFGCMSKRQDDKLIITFYITPEGDLEGLTSSISPVANSSLHINAEPKHIPLIRRKKQEKVIVSVRIQQLPYYLPEIEFMYNLNGRMGTHKFTIPCAFHKFIHIDSSSEKEVISRFQSSKNIIRGEEVPYSRKLLKNVEMLSEYFPHGTLLRDGDPNENGQIEFGGRAQWGREKFWIRILIKPSQFLCVQAAGESLSSTVEFYISLVTSLLMKNVELSEVR